MRRLLLALIAVLGLLASPLGAAPADETRFYVITFSPGTLVWELFGHNMIIEDDGSGGALPAFNWGMFDFDEAGFLPRLMMGRMMYRLDVEPNGEGLVAAYARQDERTVLLQELDLSADEARRLAAFLANNARPENLRYRYDYYRDNCSTRVRDAIDHALGGELSRATQDKPTGSTYRSETRRLTARAWGWNLALTTVMGHPIDRPISAWERSFVPSRLSEELDALRRTDGRPLVSRRKIVHASAWRKPEPSWVPFFGWINLAIGCVYGGLIAAAAWLMKRRPRTGKIAAALLVAIWCVIGGAGSLVGSWGWAFTDHLVARWNENLLVLPLPMLLLPAMWMVSRRGRATRWTIGLAVGMLACTTLAVALKVLPGMRQPNAEVWMLAWPIHVGIAWAAWTRFSTGRGQAAGVQTTGNES